MRRRSIPHHPGQQAIDPASGFKVPHANLVKQWDGEFVDRRFVDKRNPQDLLRAKADAGAIPHPRPEPEDTFFAENILWEDGGLLVEEDGDAVMAEGLLNGEGL